MTKAIMSQSSIAVNEGPQGIQFGMRVPVHLKHEGPWIYAVCRPLDVHSQGSTKKEALDNIVEALQLFIESCFERGTLDQVLKDCGFRPVHGRQLLEMKDQDECLVNVPLPLPVAQRNNARAQAC